MYLDPTVKLIVNMGAVGAVQRLHSVEGGCPLNSGPSKVNPETGESYPVRLRRAKRILPPWARLFFWCPSQGMTLITEKCLQAKAGGVAFFPLRKCWVNSDSEMRFLAEIRSLSLGQVCSDIGASCHEKSWITKHYAP